MLRSHNRLSVLAALAAALTSACDSGGIGQGDTATIKVEPPTVTFPATAAGGEVVEQVTIKNNGKRTLVVTGISLRITVGSPEHLYLVDPPETPFDLAEGFSKQVEILYAPTAGATPPQGILSITSTDGPKEVPIDTQEQLGEMKLDPGNVTWGDLPTWEGDPPGCAAPPANVQTFEVINVGSAALQITGYDLSSDDDPVPFTVCPAPYEGAGNAITQGGRRTWKVVYHPFSTGSHTAHLTVSNTQGSGQVILRGGSAGGKSIQVHPMVLSWPTLPKDECGELTVVIMNTGTIPLKVFQFRFEPPELEDYYRLSGEQFDGEQYNLRGAIPRGEQTVLRVTYCAEPEEPLTGWLEIHHSATPEVESPLNVELRGNQAAPQLGFSPPSIQINGTAPGTSSDEYPVVIRNLGGAPLTVTSTEIGPSPAGGQGQDNFSVSHGGLLDIEIPSGRFETVYVQYSRPQEHVGTDFACLEVVHDDPFQDPKLCIQLIAAHAANLPPVASIAFAADSPAPPVPTGTEVCVDASGSTDAADDPAASICRYDWLLVDRPMGSSADVSPVRSEAVGELPPDPICCLTTDVPGTYIVTMTATECSLGEGHNPLRSPPARIEIVANPSGL